MDLTLGVISALVAIVSAFYTIKYNRGSQKKLLLTCHYKWTHGKYSSIPGHYLEIKLVNNGGKPLNIKEFKIKFKNNKLELVDPEFANPPFKLEIDQEVEDLIPMDNLFELGIKKLAITDSTGKEFKYNLKDCVKAYKKFIRKKNKTSS